MGPAASARPRRSTSPSCARRTRSCSLDNRPEHAHLARDGPRAGARAGTRLHGARGRSPATCADSDVVVLLSATPLTVGTSRLEYLGRTRRSPTSSPTRSLAGWDGLLVVVTNPVDPLVTRLQAANRARPAPDHRLHAQRQPAPEDGPRAWPSTRRPGASRRGCWASTATRASRSSSRVKVDGVPVQPTRRAGGGRRGVPPHLLRAARRARLGSIVDLDVRTRRRAHGRRRSTATGELWPASVVLDGEYGIEGVAVTVPGDDRARAVPSASTSGS